MPNPVQIYRSIYDFIPLIDGFQSQYTYLSFSDIILPTDSFTSPTHYLFFGDHLYLNDYFKPSDSYLILSDSLHLIDYFKNVHKIAFTDILNLIDIWNPVSTLDIATVIESFDFIRATTIDETLLIVNDEFILAGIHSQHFSDILSVASSFSLLVMPHGTIIEKCP